MKKFFLYIYLCLCPLLAKAQTSSEILSVKSPNVASLGIYSGKTVSLSMDFCTNNIMNPNSFYTVANIGIAGRPFFSNQTFNYSNWKVQILPSGDIQLMMTSGTALPAASRITISGSYIVF